LFLRISDLSFSTTTMSTIGYLLMLAAAVLATASAKSNPTCVCSAVGNCIAKDAAASTLGQKFLACVNKINANMTQCFQNRFNAQLAKLECIGAAIGVCSAGTSRRRRDTTIGTTDDATDDVDDSFRAKLRACMGDTSSGSHHGRRYRRGIRGLHFLMEGADTCANSLKCELQKPDKTKFKAAITSCNSTGVDIRHNFCLCRNAAEGTSDSCDNVHDSDGDHHLWKKHDDNDDSDDNKKDDGDDTTGTGNDGTSRGGGDAGRKA